MQNGSISILERALDKLEEVHSRLRGSEQPAEGVIEEAGYAAVHLTRYATEIVFQELHKVEDIAPGLKDERIYGVTFKQAREYLRASMLTASKKGSPKERTMLSVATLLECLKLKAHAFRLAVLAKEVAILLLGPDRLGGVYAEWQTSTLGVGLLSWQEQESLNRRILGRARSLDNRQASRDGGKFDLPPVKYIEVGCYGNIAKACFRAVADETLEGLSAEQVAEIGSQMLRSSEREIAIDPDQYAEYLVATMYAMEAAIREHLGDANFAKTFWERLEPVKAADVVQDVLRIEPSQGLRELVLTSARSAGAKVDGLVPRHDVRRQSRRPRQTG